jgi:UDP-N-acetylglucosamine enolpyruvyl transferase
MKMGTKLKQILTVQFTIADAPWPGFTPDLLSIVLVVATQAKEMF